MLLTTKEAAAILGVQPVRIRQLVAGCRLKNVGKGRDILLLESEVRAHQRGKPGRRKKPKKVVVPS